MATKKKLKVKRPRAKAKSTKRIAEPKVKRHLVLAAGPAAFQEYLTKNSEMFNLTELERMMSLPNGTLRHIRTGARIATPKLYEKLVEIVLPKMCEMVFVLQNYTGTVVQKEIGW